MIPVVDFHGSAVVKFLVHLERIPQHVWLVTPAFLEAFIFCPVEIVPQDWLIVGMSTLLNDHPSTLSG